MVRSRGPLASLSAAGAIGGTISFRRSQRGTNIVRHFVPHDPKTPAQLGARALMRLLQSIWKLATQAQKDAWKPSPESSNQQAYLAFLKRNLLEFRHFKSPLLTLPRSTAVAPWGAAANTITALIHSLQLHRNAHTGGTQGCYLIYRRAGGTPEEVQSEFIHGTYALTNIALDYTDIVPTLGTYGYSACRWLPDGSHSTMKNFTATAPLDF